MGAARIDLRLGAGTPSGLQHERLRALIRFALAAEGRTDRPRISFVFVDDATIQRLHAVHMALDEPTDVLTFALDEPDGFISGEREPLLGEVVISHETAAEQAIEAGHSVERELAFLCLHGLLHLLGYSDTDEMARAAMLARQEQLLRAFEATHGGWPAGASQPL